MVDNERHQVKYLTIARVSQAQGQEREIAFLTKLLSSNLESKGTMCNYGSAVVGPATAYQQLLSW